MKNLAFLFLTFLISACGSTSNLRHPQKSTDLLNFSNYTYVIVNDFKDGASKSFDDPNIIS
jgi:hypothetical protein